MNSNSGSGSRFGSVGGIIFAILALVALYYLYQYLYGNNGLEGKTLVTSIKPANSEKPLIFIADQLPAIYEGGEFSINTWIYINDFAINRGKNKAILTLGGASFATLAIFLGPYKNSLNIRVHTRGSDSAVTGNAAMGPNSSTGPEDLSNASLTSLFTGTQTDTSLTDMSRPCDISSVDMQRWIQVTVCLNNKTCDVYLDGKLARSCILPSFYRVDKTNFALTMVPYGGFGGFVSNSSAYNYALNPELVWRLYMSGPGPQYSLTDYITSLFDPKAVGALDYPKQNITP
jgi:hypothetical protein